MKDKPLKLLTPLFGPIGDMLMLLALIDDILTLNPRASFRIIARNNAKTLTDLARAYPQVEVQRIPKGLASFPFLFSLLCERRTLMTVGVAGYYSIWLKLFFLVFGALGNKTAGMADRENRGHAWLPLQTIIPLEFEPPMLEQFRRLLPSLGFSEAQLKHVYGRPPHVLLQTSLPADFPFAPGQYIVAHLFGMALWRSFTPHRWKALLTALAREHPELPIILTGAQKDRAAAEDIARAVPGVHMYIGLPILEVAGIIDNAALYIGVDTGITHLAGVLNQKSIVISHRGDPRWQPLYNPNARILMNSRRCTCPNDLCMVREGSELYRRCLYDITDGAVLSSVALALSSPSRHVPNFAGWADEHTMAKPG